MNIDELESVIEGAIESFLGEANCVSADQFGLDERAGQRVFVDLNGEWLAVRGDHDRRMLEYYGGFEYIAAEDKKVFGDLVVYTINSSRVAACFENMIADFLQ